LQNYYWKGNIRQLENEIRSIVNLTDDGETVTYDILSEEIKTIDNRDIHTTSLKNKYIYPLLGGKIDKETEKKSILQVLESNNWNKSQTARDLNMTYRGLHKKMQRLGIHRE
jgi:transcriptional regulator with GAF, ATPase, and Fis domain